MIVQHALILIVSLAGLPSSAIAQQDAQQATGAVQRDAALAECAQVQPAVQQLLDAASTRLEAARQTNDAKELRAAVDVLDAALRDLRAQLAPCKKVDTGGSHAGHAMPNVQRAPAAAPGTPAMAPGSPTTAPAAVAPAAKPPTGAVDPHAGHTMPATTPATKSAPTAPPTTKPAPARTSKPPATPKPPVDPHAGHTMPAAKTAPSPSNPSAAKPSAPAKPPDPHAGHTTASPTPAPSNVKPSTSTPAPPAKPPADPHAAHTNPASSGEAPTTAVDPVCGLKVDPATAPAATHAGQTFHFCSEQHQQLFQKNATKYLPKR